MSSTSGLATTTNEGTRPSVAQQLRVLLVHTDLVGGGIEQAMTTLAKHLPGERAICYTPSNHPAPPVESVAAITEAGVQLFQIPTPLVRPAYGRRLLNVMRQYQPDVVHLHGCLTGVWGGWLARRAHGRQAFVYTQHSNHSIDARWLQALARRTFPRLDHIVCVSDAVRADLLSLPGRGALSGRITVIPNGIDLGPFQRPVTPEERTTLRREFGAKNGDLLVGSVGLLWPVKGYHVLIAAFARVLQQLPTARLVLIGRGEQEAELRRLAADLGVSGHVTFAGWRGDVPRLLRALDLYVQPSLSEGLPIAPIEASAAGLPIVATRVGGMPEVVLDGETGLLTAPGNPAALASVIVELADGPGRAHELGRAAQERARLSFSAEAMATRHVALYEQL